MFYKIPAKNVKKERNNGCTKQFFIDQCDLNVLGYSYQTKSVKIFIFLCECRINWYDPGGKIFT